MKLNFDILTTLLGACSNQTGKTIDEMKDSVPWATCKKQLQAIIDHMVNEKFVSALPSKSKNGERLPTRWVINKHLRNTNQTRASNRYQRQVKG